MDAASRSREEGGAAAADAGAPVTAQRLEILLSAHDHDHHHSLALEILARARHDRLAGATLIEGIAGRGRSGSLHRSHLVADDAPLALNIVDTPERLAAFLATHRDLLARAVVTLSDVEAFNLRGAGAEDASSP